MNIRFEKVNTPARGISIGQREGRFSERQPAGRAEAAKAGFIIPFKAACSRVNSLLKAIRPSFELRYLAHALIDVFAVIFGLFFIALFAGAVGVAIGILVFVLRF